jgi:hypothetical protein
MKTIQLSLVFAAALAGAPGAFAQNPVAYYNVDLYPGFNMIADQLQSGNNTLSNLLNNGNDQYDGLEVFKWDGTNFQSDVAGAPTVQTNPGNGWMNNGVITMNPGEAVWIKNANPTNVILTFSGAILEGTLTNTIPGPNAFSMLSSQVPQTGDLATNLGFTNFNQGDTIYVFTASNQAYRTFNYDTNTGNSGWLGNFSGGSGDPIIQIGQGFWYKTGANAPATTTWIRTFYVNQ